MTDTHGIESEARAGRLTVWPRPRSGHCKRPRRTTRPKPRPWSDAARPRPWSMGSCPATRRLALRDAEHLGELRDIRPPTEPSRSPDDGPPAGTCEASKSCNRNTATERIRRPYRQPVPGPSCRTASRQRGLLPRFKRGRGNRPSAARKLVSAARTDTSATRSRTGRSSCCPTPASSRQTSHGSKAASPRR